MCASSKSIEYWWWPQFLIVHVLYAMDSLVPSQLEKTQHLDFLKRERNNFIIIDTIH